VKKRVIEHAEGRKALHERLLFALEGEPDPWAERAAGAAGTEFASFAPAGEPA
jgi:nitrite reductase (NADH) large subunit